MRTLLPLHLKVEWWWGIAAVALVVVAFTLVLGAKKAGPSWRSWLRGIGALSAVLALVAAATCGVLVFKPKPNSETCQRPDQASVAASSVRKSAKTLQSHVGRARQNLRTAKQGKGGPAQVKRLTKALRQATRARDKAQGATATLDSNQSEFKLGRDVNAGAHSVRFTLDKRVRGPRFVTTGMTPFSQSSGGRELTTGSEQGPTTGGETDSTTSASSADISAWAILDSDRRHGTLYFCVNPRWRLSTSASGQFMGSFVITDPRVNRLDIGATVDMPYPSWEYVVLAGLVTCLFCTAYTFYLRRSTLPPCLGGTLDLKDECGSGTVLRPKFVFLKGWFYFYTDILGVLTLAAGFAGATTAFIAQYVASDSWDASVKTWITFIGAIATAFIASATAGKLAQKNFDGTVTNENPAGNPDGTVAAQQ